jgi:hypothetical protein
MDRAQAPPTMVPGPVCPEQPERRT